MGAGLSPSAARRIDQSPSPGSSQRCVRAPSAVSSLVHRSEPLGLGTDSSPSANSVRSPSPSAPVTRRCAASPTQASTSAARPTARVNWPSERTVMSTSRASASLAEASITVTGPLWAPAGTEAVTVSGGAQKVSWPMPNSTSSAPTTMMGAAIFKRTQIPVFVGVGSMDMPGRTEWINPMVTNMTWRHGIVCRGSPLPGAAPARRFVAGGSTGVSVSLVKNAAAKRPFERRRERNEA